MSTARLLGGYLGNLDLASKLHSGAKFKNLFPNRIEPPRFGTNSAGAQNTEERGQHFVLRIVEHQLVLRGNERCQI